MVGFTYRSRFNTQQIREKGNSSMHLDNFNINLFFPPLFSVDILVYLAMIQNVLIIYLNSICTLPNSIS